MNRSQFMAELSARLSQLPPEELSSALLYYSEYFDDAGQENEAQVISELGAPEQVAAQIIEDYAAKYGRIPELPKNEAKEKSGAGSNTLMLVLAICAAPIVLPIALALVITAFAVVFAFLVASGALIAAGITVSCAAFAVVMQSPPTTLLFLGAGLIVTGIGLAFMVGSVVLTKVTFKGAAALTYRCFGKRRG